jgi:hypothetical protein
MRALDLLHRFLTEEQTGPQPLEVVDAENSGVPFHQRFLDLFRRFLTRNQDELDVVEGSPEDGPSDLEKLSGGEYYPVGLAPRVSHLGAKTMDVFRMMRGLRGRSVGKTFFYMANIPANEDAEARGLEELVFYETVQDMLDESEPGYGERIPVLLMSQMDEESLGFEAMLERVRKECCGNPEFEEAVYAAVPKNMRHRRFRKKKHTLGYLRESKGIGDDDLKKRFLASTYEEFEALPKLTAPLKNAYEKMEYVLQQVALVLCLRGRKLGHEREEIYDEAARIAARILKFGETHFDRQTISFEGEDGTIPYREENQVEGEVNTTLLSAHDSLEVSRLPTHILDTKDLVEVMRIIQGREQYRDREYDRLKKRLGLADRLYGGMINRAKILPDVEEPMRVRVSESIAFRYASEIIMTLAEGPKKFYVSLFEETGIMRVVRGKQTIAQWKGASHLLPFSCVQNEGETDTHYFLRFVNELLHDEGPVIPDQGRTGVIYGLSCKLRKLAGIEEAEGDDFDLRNHAWSLHYGGFTYRMFFRSNMLVWDKEGERLLTPEESTERKWETMKAFFDIIRNTPLELIYRTYMGLSTEGLIAQDRFDPEAFLPFLTTPHLGDDLKAYFCHSLDISMPTDSL